jgi:ribose 5-phosphate isomerase RpiB
VLLGVGGVTFALGKGLHVAANSASNVAAAHVGPTPSAVTYSSSSSQIRVLRGFGG